MKRKMIKISTILVFILFLFGKVNSQITWNGLGADNNFSTPGNWVGGVVPGSSDDVVFDGTSSKPCLFDISPINLLSISINSGYGGTINGGSSLVTLTGDFTQGAGTFLSTTDSLIIDGGDMIVTGGTFNHNSGAVVMKVPAGGTNSFSGTILLNYLAIRNGSGSSSQRNVDFGTATSAGTVLLDGGARLYGYQGLVSISDLLDIRGTNGSMPSSHTGTFSLGGVGNCTLTSNYTALVGNILPTVEFNTAGNIELLNAISVLNNWNHISGTMKPNASEVYVIGFPTNIMGNGNAFYHLESANTSDVYFPANAEVTVAEHIVNRGGMTFPATNVLGFNGAGNQNFTNYVPSIISLGSIRIYSTVASRLITPNY